MRFSYDSQLVLPGDDPVRIANHWGKDGWRCLNLPEASAFISDSTPNRTLALFFELAEEGDPRVPAGTQETAAAFPFVRSEPDGSVREVSPHEWVMPG